MDMTIQVGRVHLGEARLWPCPATEGPASCLSSQECRTRAQWRVGWLNSRPSNGTPGFRVGGEGFPYTTRGWGTPSSATARVPWG
jgi:hypothetical protein